MSLRKLTLVSEVPHPTVEGWLGVQRVCSLQWCPHGSATLFARPGVSCCPPRCALPLGWFGLLSDSIFGWFPNHAGPKDPSVAPDVSSRPDRSLANPIFRSANPRPKVFDGLLGHPLLSDLHRVGG